MFQQPVHGGDGREGFSGSGGHLYEGFGSGVLEGGFEVGDGIDLAVSEAGRVECGEVSRQSSADGFIFFEPFGEGFGPVEGEDFAVSWLGVAGVGEFGDLSGAEVEEREGFVVDVFEFGLGVCFELIFVSGHFAAFFRFFCFDDADGFAVYEQYIIGGSDFGGIFSDGDAMCGGQVEGIVILDDPAALLELVVDVIAGELFRVAVGHLFFMLC